MPAEKDPSVDISDEVMHEIRKIFDILDLEREFGDKMEIINLGDMDSTVEEMEMMALMHYLRKGLPPHEAEKEAKETVKLQLEMEREFEKLDRAKQLPVI